MNPTSGPSCRDCGVTPGSAHADGCDVAVCLRSGRQRFSCPAGAVALHDCGQDVWTGLWPGQDECREYGWYCYWRDPEPGQRYGSWVRCSADHPGATEDLNRLHDEGRWDPAARRWRRGRCEHQYTEHIVVDDGQPDRLLECGKCGLLLEPMLLQELGHEVPRAEGDSWRDIR